MTNNQLQRVIRLIKKTGDKAVVLDPASDEVLVLMSLDKYEDLACEADWCGPDHPKTNDRESFEFDNDSFDNNPFTEDNLQTSPPLSSANEDFSGFEPEFSADEATERETLPTIASTVDASQKTALQFSPNWAENNATPAEENLADIPHEEEEEKFYLEPIE